MKFTFLTVLYVLAVLNTIWWLSKQPQPGLSETADIIWTIYFCSSTLAMIFFGLADIVYQKVENIKATHGKTKTNKHICNA